MIAANLLILILKVLMPQQVLHLLSSQVIDS